MPMFTFHSDAPTAFALDVDHGELGARMEHLMRHPAYLDASHKDHMEVVDRVKTLAAAISGDKLADSGSQPYPVFSFQTGGETVATGTGTPDEHLEPGRRVNEER